MLFDFATILVFFIVAVGFVFGALFAGRFIRPNLPDPQKSVVYECGEKPIGKGWFNFNPRFYLMALVFIIFDVEIALTFPVAVVVKKWIGSGRALYAVIEIALFIGILAAALVFVWAKGHLDWARDVENPEGPSMSDEARSGAPTIIEATVLPGAVATRIDHAINWFRQSSIWYLLFATACCGIELMQAGGPRTDLDRFGAVFRASPRQSDLLIVAGALTYKMADRVRLLWAQMADPKYVIAMGSCANSGGLFQRSYSVLCGADKIVPVDLYIPGCPPRPEALADAILRLQVKMRDEHWASKRRGGVTSR